MSNELKWQQLTEDQREVLRKVYRGPALFGGTQREHVEDFMMEGLVTWDEQMHCWLITPAGRALVESADHIAAADDTQDDDLIDERLDAPPGVDTTTRRHGTLQEAGAVANAIFHEMRDREEAARDAEVEYNASDEAECWCADCGDVPVNEPGAFCDKCIGDYERAEASLRRLRDADKWKQGANPIETAWLNGDYAAIVSMFDEQAAELAAERAAREAGAVNAVVLLAEIERLRAENAKAAEVYQAAIRERNEAEADAAALKQQRTIWYLPEWGYQIDAETIDYIILTNNEEHMWSERHPALKETIEEGYATVLRRAPVSDAGTSVHLKLTEKGEQRKLNFIHATQAGAALLERLAALEDVKSKYYELLAMISYYTVTVNEFNYVKDTRGEVAKTAADALKGEA